RTSASQESRGMSIDFGAHHRMSSSGLVHASNTRRAGASKVRVTTNSRSDFHSTVVRFFIGVGSLSLGEVRDRSTYTSIVACTCILNHAVQHLTHASAACKGVPTAAPNPLVSTRRRVADR